MSVPTLEVVEPGAFTTVQDLGRYGYQRYGVPVSGAMDSFALRAGNGLLGNDEGAAALEMAVRGPTLRLLSETWVALTGADLGASLDGERLPMWRAMKAAAGATLRFEGPRDGIRAYLCLAGGIDVPVVLGSRSTYVKSGFGGLRGRALREHDVLACFGLAPGATPPSGPGLDPALVPVYGHHHDVAVVLGPQHRAFTSGGLFTFLNSMYTVSVQSDRTGYRLLGPKVEHRDKADIISDGLPPGAVQVPGDGRPIVLLADRGTTGGYAKIATVVSAHLSTLAQAAPEDTISFRGVTPEQALALRAEQEARLRTLAAPNRRVGLPRLGFVVDGEAYEVTDDAGGPISDPGLGPGGATMPPYRTTVRVGRRTYAFDVEVRERR